MVETNGGVLIFPGGFVGATGNQTAGGSYPGLQLPANKVPTAVALTTYNEFALVTIWDTAAERGQIAVIALRADSPPAFSVPYFALPNEGGFTGMHLLGFVDLPELRAPTAIAASGNNGATPGGHAIGNEFKNMDADPTLRQAFARDDGERWVANAGYAVVASRWEGKLTFLDLAPLFRFVRDAYFTTDAKWQASSAKDGWPHTFDSAPTARPTVLATLPLPGPTAVRVGNQVGAFPKGLQNSINAFVADAGGAVHLYDVGGATIHETARADVGANLTYLTLRQPYNRAVLAVSRGARLLAWLDVGESALTVSRTLRDSRMDDPVVADVNDRGPVVTVGDFTGKKLLTFRVGATENNAGKPPANFGCGSGGADASSTTFEFGGALALPGSPFFLGTTNVN